MKTAKQPIMLHCRICMWFNVSTEATRRAKAPDGTWHNLCGDHALLYEAFYRHTEILSATRKLQILNQTSTEQLRENPE